MLWDKTPVVEAKKQIKKLKAELKQAKMNQQPPEPPTFTPMHQQLREEVNVLKNFVWSTFQPTRKIYISQGTQTPRSISEGHNIVIDEAGWNQCKAGLEELRKAQQKQEIDSNLPEILKQQQAQIKLHELQIQETEENIKSLQRQLEAAKAAAEEKKKIKAEKQELRELLKQNKELELQKTTLEDEIKSLLAIQSFQSKHLE